MEYLTCPTCGYLIGQKSIEYNNERDKIWADKKNNSDMVNDKLSKLMKSLKIRRYCCKMRLMSCKDLSKELIAPID